MDAQACGFFLIRSGTEQSQLYVFTLLRVMLVPCRGESEHSCESGERHADDREGV